MKSHNLVIDKKGTVHTIYHDDLRLPELGAALGSKPEIKRASQVEPAEGGWRADMALSGGPKLPVRVKRSEALALEHGWLLQHHLGLGGAS